MKATRDTLLREMDLSIRAINCLNAAEIYTFGELLDYGDLDALLKFRHIGKRTITELKELLAEQKSL
jgi:DNA-directed RNA polymerase subunit alpha